MPPQSPLDLKSLAQTLMILLLYAIPIKAGAQSYGVNPQAYDWYPKYVTFLPEDKLDSVLQYANTDLVPVIYKQDRTELQSNPQLDSICDIIKNVLHDGRVSLAYIWIGGSASPEGSLSRNRYLGEIRAQRLVEYLRSYADVEARLIRADNLWEDWYSVTRALERKNIDPRVSPYKDDTDGSKITGEVLNIIRKNNDWTIRKQKLKSINKQKVWRWLIDNTFPPFRNARMVIVCHAEATPPTRLPEIYHKEVVFPRSGYLAEVPHPRLPYLHDRFFAIKGNLLGYALLEANLGFEIELWRRTSLDVPVWYSPYDITSTRKARLLGIQPEFRYWLGPDAGKGFFAGAHFHVLGFNIQLNDHARYQDPNHALIGGGLGFGYATHLDKKQHWLLEMNIGAGYANYLYDSYRPWENGLKFSSRRRKEWWGPTRAGVTIGYKWYWKNKQKGGVR